MFDYIENIQKCAKDATTKPEYFAYWGNNDMFDTWGFCGIDKNGASDLIEESNFECITKELMTKYPNDFRIEFYNHWAVGNLDRLVCRVYEIIDGEKKISEAFYAAMEIKNHLEDYGVYDESHYLDLKFEQDIKTIYEFPGIRQLVRETEIDEEFWHIQVYQYITDWGLIEDISEYEIMSAIYELKLCSTDSIEEWNKWCDENNKQRIEFYMPNPNQLTIDYSE
jgi:hypothetical protein